MKERTGTLASRMVAGSFLFVILASFPPIGHAEHGGLDDKKLLLYGGAGNQRGNGLSSYASDLYVAGVDEAVLGGQALALRYTLAFDGGSPVLDWAIRWPGAANGSGNPNSEVFEGVVATRGGVVFAGRSWSQTQDGVGDKEHKSVLVKFPLTGATASGIGGADWVAKPNFFAYRGNESFLSVAFGADRIGSTHYFYASGYAQANGANNTAILAQYTSDGTLRWSRVLGNTGAYMSSFGTAVTTLNGYVYVLGLTHYPYTDPTATKVTLWKYDDAGNQVWVRSQQGNLPGWRGTGSLVASRRYHSTAGDLYIAAGITYSSSTFSEVLLLRYDEVGNLLWRRVLRAPTMSNTVSYDIAHGIALNDHARTPPEGQWLYVFGKTNALGTNGWDVFHLEQMPSSDAHGAAGTNAFYKGSQDDIPWAAQRIGSYVYAVGETKSFRAHSTNGYVVGDTSATDPTPNQAGENDVMLLAYAMPQVTTPLAVSIDIKPESAENTLNPNSHGKIPVAILSTGRLKAPEVVKQATLTFGRLGSEQSLAFCNQEDANEDGLPDLVCHFNTQQTGFQAGDAQGVLKGLTTSGIPLKGADAIRLVPGAAK
ncbi:MAG: hypothetical protein HY595_03560 [Candidatus Omnitrophica bacterium]|nr:hypothetical protein [Candidatus Omnitrophota bacterium]